MRPPIPDHDGKEHLDPARMKLGDHLLDALHAAGQIAEQVELITRVDAQVGINVPDQYAVDAAIAQFEIVKKTVDCVAGTDRIVEISIVNHHLGLHQTGL